MGLNYFLKIFLIEKLDINTNNIEKLRFLSFQFIFIKSLEQTTH